MKSTNTAMTKSEEQIKTVVDKLKNPKSLKEKSMSTTALRVGPFATIRENEMKRKKKSSLDMNDEDSDDES